MWEWLTTYSVWVFIITSLVIIILLFYRDRVRHKMAQVTPDKLQVKTRLNYQRYLLGY